MSSVLRSKILYESVKAKARHYVNCSGGKKNISGKTTFSQYSKAKISQQATRKFLPSTYTISNQAQFSTDAKENIISSPWPDVEIPEVNLAHHVFENFHKYSKRDALVDGATGKTWTYAQLQDDIVKVGSALTRQGFKKGDVITLFSPNCPEFAIMYLAVAAIGGIVSAVNPLYTPAELHHALEHSGSHLVVTVPLLAPVTKKAAENCPELREIVVFGEYDGCRPFSSYLEDDGKCFPDNVPLNPVEEMLGLPYSSGTTGLPKGVMLSHYNIVANVEQINSDDVMNYNQDDVFISVLPFFHIYGQVVVLLSGLRKGVKQVTMPKFDPQMYLQLIHDHKATYLHVVPPIVLFMAKHPMVDKYDVSQVHTIFTGAAPIGSNTIEEAVDRLKVKSFRQGYGLTETSPVTHANPLTDMKFGTIGPSIPNVQYKICINIGYGLTETSPATHVQPVGGYKAGTIGLAIPSLQFKIVDIESGQSLGEGEEGELLVRGPNVMMGYFKNEEATNHTLKNGWLHTGDIGYYDEDKHVVISDRLKELIKVKGFQVAPAELEALLVTHPAIQDAAVIGVPDERAGELPRAYVVKKPNTEVNEDEVKEFVKAKVASFKNLEGGVEFREEIPKSASGKILRRNLKEELKANS